MQLTGSHSSSLPANLTRNTFSVTIINDQILLVRLVRELLRVHQELRRGLPELQRDPVNFVRQVVIRAFNLAKHQFTPSNLTGLASAILVIGSIVLIVITFDRQKVQSKDTTAVENISTGEVVMLDVKTFGDVTATGGIDRKEVGRVGLQHGNGEGSGPTAQRSQGGGSGGDRHRTPAQQGKVPPWSAIPARIQQAPPVNPPALPAAGIDIDPLLWRDIKYPAYGDPRSRSTTPSNGPGEGGGMGDDRGLGVGEGNGNGYGRGNNGNTGDGDRQVGCCGPSGGAGNNLANRDKVLRLNEVDQKARLLSKPEPHYSEDARKSGVTGTVVLRVVFSSTGEITQVRAVQTLPFGLTERAIAAAREIKFQPATKGGRPVSVYMQLEYNFNLY